MNDQKADRSNEASAITPTTCRSIDWYAEGETRFVEVNGIRVTVRFVGRKGRRARIVIEAPSGAVFRSEANWSHTRLLPEHGTK